MKFAYFLLVWYYLLNKEDQALFKNKLTDTGAIRRELYKRSSVSLDDPNSLKIFLFLSIPLVLQSISHRRKAIFSFNPKTIDDFLYIVYIENQRDCNGLSFIHRIILNRIVFINVDKNKSYTVLDIPPEEVKDPIVIEVNKNV